ncbi:MAG: DUF4845 domain-containing protein, partial [Betaproteobacteria bacterium]|nr:DUF4845 domain-containing protein [Betaproteobacteria bacterium]
MRHQRGVSLSGLLIVSFILVIVGIGGMKVIPAVIEYYTIEKNIKAITAGGQLNNATVSDVRKAFDKRADIDNITAVTGADLDISKDGADVVIAFSYAKKIP